MHYIVDGYNFGYLAHIPAREKSDDGSIVKCLYRCPALTNRANSATVVFDGAGRTRQISTHARIKVIYSRGEKADEVIKRLLESLTRARRRDYITVTNDRSLGAYCRSLGVRVISVDKFLSVRTNTKRKRRGDDARISIEKPTAISQEDIELSKIFEKEFPRGAHSGHPARSGGDQRWFLRTR